MRQQGGRDNSLSRCMKPRMPPIPGRELVSPQVWLGDQKVPAIPEASSVRGGFVDYDGGRFYRISQYDQIPPFLITVVSASDCWLFVASNGGLTAGRGCPERALFPYVSVDRLYESAGAAGPFSSLLITCRDRDLLWEPFSRDGRFTFRLSRNLYKSVEGHRLCFEEVNHDLGLTFSAEWTTSERFGFLRRVRLTNDRSEDVSVRLIDGLRNVLPSGIPRRLANEMSCLTDAYKRSEVLPGTSLAVYALSCGITDQPVAMESLVATVAWCEGLPDSRVLVREAQVDAFRHGVMPAPESDARGVRGVYAVCSEFVLAPGECHRWLMAVDEGLSQPALVDLLEIVRRGEAVGAANADALVGEERIRAIVGGADGLQAGGGESTTAHHFMNVLFNVMRGGAFLNGYEILTGDFAHFVSERNRSVAERNSGWLATLSPHERVSNLGSLVRARGDTDLERLFLEYMPLGFSRRHGDPSRPWNRFAVQLRDAAGNDVFEYEGNWRDIFQNWEALGIAYPGFLEHMVAKFVNASTLDGHNPYRITRGGIEWEVPAPDDPWAGIGYWGDHQIIYLLKLLEWAEHFAPGRFHQWLERPVFSYAAVPYRIVDYESMRRDPRTTINFDHAMDDAIREREKVQGSDARLVCDSSGRILHVTLAEKLLVTALARLANLIPGAGIWMNTQRPEWNDANNALVGFGVSGVTLCHLRRYLVFCRRLFADLAKRDVELSAAVADFAGEICGALKTAAGKELLVVNDPAARRRMVDKLAGAASVYRSNVYEAGPGPRRIVPGSIVVDVFDSALPLVEASMSALRRSDGLFHSYRLLRFPDDATLVLDDLPLMLEGQVAALASGWLGPDEVVALLEALRASALNRPDQKSYLLYPDGSPPGFLERNIVPDEVVARTPLLGDLLAAGDVRLVCRDARGCVRFHHDLTNADALETKLDELSRDLSWADRAVRGAEAVRIAYEGVFGHRKFTGRSGAMFAYEGLGCIYWHMVSKLLVAIQDAQREAANTGHPAAARLARAYFEVRAGLGCNKEPAQWGAFPTDPHSHTPGHAGAQQPGMTGQVKEGVLSRFGELGVVIEDGRILFSPRVLGAGDFLADARTFEWMNAAGQSQKSRLAAGTLAFTLCGTLVVYVLGAGEELFATVAGRSGEVLTTTDAKLSAEASAGIFDRTGEIDRIVVTVGRRLISGG